MPRTKSKTITIPATGSVGGRPKGVKNLRTRIKNQAIDRAVEQQLARMTEAEIEALTPLSVLELAMRNAVRAGDFVAAAAAAEKAAPYRHAKQLATPPEMQMPWELRPDPPSCPDEPGPPGGPIDERRGLRSDPPPCPTEPGPANPIW